jgi:MFS superfamily sulfate permease-like transporter
MVAGTGTWLGPDSYLTGLLCAALVLALLFSRIVPAALVLFAAGIAIAVWKDPGVVGSMELNLALPAWSPLAWGDFASSFAEAALPQIPLTTLNSVIAVAALALDLFPDRPASAKKIAVSVGLMNLCGMWFGAMPMCHGAGGLAAQYRFGARTNGSILFLGAAKAIVAILFGSSLMALCAAFPASVLGVMLVFTGIELAAVARDQIRWGDAFVAILTAGVCIGLHHVALGFAMGLVVAWFFKLWPAREGER